MSKPRRKRPTLRDRLAAMLLTLERPYGGTFVPVIPPIVAATLSADAILALFDWHHVHPVALGGDNSPMNLRPMLRADHQARFTLDMGEIAKVRRGTKKRAAKALADLRDAPRTIKAAKPKRLMQYTAMKAHKRTFGGRTVERDQ